MSEAAADAVRRVGAARAALLHLRLPFVFVLAPIFLWGAWASPVAGPGDRMAFAFLLVHLALYPGANAFNSAFDRDAGPVGGLARPPETPRGLAGGATALQATGAVLAPLVGTSFALAYLLLWGIFTAYSHPRVRLKASPALSTAAIVLGQGGLGFWLGWSAAGGGRPGFQGALALGAAMAAVGALYPWSQAYQVAADAARGERTLASLLGPRGTALWTAGGFALAAVTLVLLRLSPLAAWAALGAAGFGLVAARGGAPDHRLVMTVLYLNSAAFLAGILVLLAW